MGLSADFNVAVLPVYIVCSVGFLANLMLLIALIKDPLRCFRNSATYLVGNLTVSDLLFSIVFLLKHFQDSGTSLFDFFQFFSFYLSMGTIFSISLDRFLIIRYPFKHRVLMNGNKMAIWICLVWCFSLVHPIKNIFARDRIDNIVKPAVGSILILSSSFLYGRAYFVLREQARSMADKKVLLSSEQNLGKTSSLTKDRLISESDAWKTSLAVLKLGNARNNGLKNEPGQNQPGQYQKRAARKHCNVVTDNRIKNDVCESFHCQDAFVQKQDQQAQNLDKHAPDQCGRDHEQGERGENQDDPASYGIEIAVNRGKQAQNNVNSSFRLQERSDGFNRIVDNISQNDSSHIPSNKYSRAVKVFNTANKQRFLNTIILITFIVVVTVFPSTIYFQVLAWHGKVRPDNPESPGVLISLFITLFCLNFAVNPFIYCLRLKNYQETLKKVYCCKC